MIKHEDTMGTKERIFHSVLLEIVGVLMTVIAATFVVEETVTHLTGLAIIISLVAMTFNYVYNLAFDRIYGDDRLSRGLWLRVGHGLFFEMGMVIITTPLLMYALELSFLKVLLMDLVMVAAFMVLVIVYNWCYDHARARFLCHPNPP